LTNSFSLGSNFFGKKGEGKTIETPLRNKNWIFFRAENENERFREKARAHPDLTLKRVMSISDTSPMGCYRLKLKHALN
jgi:hypothetical protein